MKFKALKRITGFFLLIGAMIFIGIPMFGYYLVFEGMSKYNGFMDELMLPIIRMID